MQYERCKCGFKQSVSVGGEFSPACVTCAKCKSTLSTHPDYHDDPEPHDWVKRFDRNTGEFSHYECSGCGVEHHPFNPNEYDENGYVLATA